MNNTESNVQWTAIFIVATGRDPIFQSEARGLVKELQGTALNDQMNIVMCMSTPVENIQLMDPTYTNPLELRDDAIATAFYTIERNETGTNDFRRFKEADGFVLQDGASISAFINEATQPLFRAQRYMMFTWDHGAVFGIFGKKELASAFGEDLGMEVENIDALTDIIVGAKKRNYINNAVLHDLSLHTESVAAIPESSDTTPDTLTVRELSDAIKSAFGTKKIEVLVMTNCFMQAFDTGYEFKDTVEYLVAPETAIYMTGFNYKAILETICGDPAIAAETIASVAIESYDDKSMLIADATYRSGAMNEVVVSAVNLAHYERLAVLIDEMAKILIGKLETNLADIIEARQTLDPIKRGMKLMMVDPYSFFNFLVPRLNEDHYSEYVAAFNEAHKDAVVHLFAGKHFLPDGPRERFRPHGFTVYFPLNENDINLPLSTFLDEQSEDVNSFVLRYSWDNFVAAFAKKVGM